MASTSNDLTEIKLNPIEATPESFHEFGQVVEASPDGDEFGPQDAQLDLSRGIPRSSELDFDSFYVTSSKIFRNQSFDI